MSLDKAIVIVLVALGIGSLLWIQLCSDRSDEKGAAEDGTED